MPLNILIIQGNLTREFEIKYTTNGKAVAQSAVAVNRKWKDESGAEREECTFVDCTAWGRAAEVLAQYTRKGHAVLLTGRLKQDQWEDKQTGQKRSKLAMVIESFSFLNNKDGGERQESPKAGEPSSRHRDEQPPEDDDTPF